MMLLMITIGEFSDRRRKKMRRERNERGKRMFWIPFHPRGSGGEFESREWTNSYGYGLRVVYGMCKQNVWDCMKEGMGWELALYSTLDRY
jgi:hypothetical protein